MSYLDPDNLLIVLAIAEEGSITGAARVLHTSQPALTRTVRNLETRVGTELFIRGPRGVVPTEFGAVLADHGRVVRAAIEHATRDLTTLGGQGVRQLSIGIVPYVAISPVGTTLHQVSNNPHLTLRVSVGPLGQLTEALRAGDLDLLVGPFDVTDPDLVSELLFYDSTLIAGRSAHPLIEKDPVDVEALALADWILPPRGDTSRDNVDNFFRAEGLTAPDPSIECEDVPLRMHMIVTSDLLTVLPQGTGIGVIPLTTFRLPEPMSTHRIALIRRRVGHIPPEADAIINALKENLSTTATMF